VSKELLKKAAAGSLKQEVPSFRVGDTVNVSTRIVEGEKERVQVFRGTVIRRCGGGVSETFTVRRIVNNEGVERTFPLHSPNVVGVEVVRSGKTRRSKLYFLRDRVGRATRLRDVDAAGKPAAGADAEEAPDQGEEADEEE
jgi:large subunit ribosomal protein L19